MENKATVSLERIEFSSYSIPEFKETPGKDWVNNGEDNCYPQHLITLFDSSSKHNAIVTGVADMIKGDGFKIDPSMTPDQARVLSVWMDHPNPYENANDVLEKTALDLKLFGGFYLEVIWDRAGQKIVQMYHLPYNEMRVSKDGNKFYRCSEWKQFTRKPDIEFCKFNPLQKDKGGKPQVFFYKQYRPGLTYYPLPDYISCKQNIETDSEIANFHNNNIKSNFSAGTIVSFFNGEPTQEEKRQIKLKLTGQHTGTDNAGGFVLNFADKPDQVPAITRLQPDELDKQYLQLYQTISDEIFIGHRVTNPSIFGVKVAGQLGTRLDLIDSRGMFYQDYIKAKVAIIERSFNYLLQYVVQGAKIVIQKSSLDDSTSTTDTAIPNPTIASQPIGQPAKLASNQKTEEDILLIFSQYGEPAKNYRIIKSKRLHFHGDDEIPKIEHTTLRALAFANVLNVDISDDQAKVLGAIKQNPSLTVADISNLTGLDPDSVNEALNYLSDNKVISINGTDGTISITDNGLKTIKESDLLSTEIFVKYKYSGPQDSRNRPFCAKLMDMDRLYSRDDINNVSDAAGYNVWTQRGGWYHNPATDVNTPYCRHTWAQVVVKKKARL